MTTACTGAAAGSPPASSASIAADRLGLGSFGWPAIKVLTAPTPAVAGVFGGTEAAATASAARLLASLSPVVGSASRNDPHPGMFLASSDTGLVCSAGNVPQFWSARAALSCGLIARTTGVVATDRLSVMILAPATACSRAVETPLAGIHSAGRCPSSEGHGPTNPLMTLSESAAFTPILMRWSPTGPVDLL